MQIDSNQYPNKLRFNLNHSSLLTNFNINVLQILQFFFGFLLICLYNSTLLPLRKPSYLYCFCSRFVKMNFFIPVSPSAKVKEEAPDMKGLDVYDFEKESAMRNARAGVPRTPTAADQDKVCMN